MEYLAELIQPGPPVGNGQTTRGFRGSTFPSGNNTYASTISRQIGKQLKLNLPGDEVDGGG
jgi:hypothetical protein